MTTTAEPTPGVYPRYFPEALPNPQLVTIHGYCAPGWESVRSTMKNNFIINNERGCALCIFYRGEKVVDLWAGERYLDVPWCEDTMTNVFSTGKGIAALGLALLHSRGLLNYDEKVSTYWPEFACHNKQNITVKELLSHSAGLCCIEKELTLDVLQDYKKLGDALTCTKPEWNVQDCKNGYMGITIGWYADQLCRIIDPKKRSIIDFVTEEITMKLKCENELYIGLPSPDVLPRARIASLNAFGLIDIILRSKMPSQFTNHFVFKPSSVTARTFKNPSCLGDVRQYGTETIRKLCIPAGNCHATARAIAACYDAILACQRSNNNASTVGFKKGTLDLLSAKAPSQFDEVLRLSSSFAYGFTKPDQNQFIFGSNDKCFGCPGIGGSLGFADPDLDLSYCYITNRLGLHMIQDPRELTLRREVYRILRGKGCAVVEQTPDPVLQRLLDTNSQQETTRFDAILHHSYLSWMIVLFFCIVIRLILWCIY